MFVLFKDDSGYHVRPVFIGSIKNNPIRRTLCTLMYPFTFVFTIALNLTVAVTVCLCIVFNAIYTPFKTFVPIWKTDIWNNPRSK